MTIDVSKNEGEAFTGGSNIQPPLPMPQFANQRCPVKYFSTTDFMDMLKKGVEFKLGPPKEKSPQTSLAQWFKALGDKLELYGLDTVLKVPNHSVTDETYIAENWGKAKESLVNPSINYKHPPCPYDRINLYYSGVFIL